jgi:hypothetical protein
MTHVITYNILGPQGELFVVHFTMPPSDTIPRTNPTVCYHPWLGVRCATKVFLQGTQGCQLPFKLWFDFARWDVVLTVSLAFCIFPLFVWLRSIPLQGKG